MDIEDLHKFQEDRPAKWTCFGSKEDFDKMPHEHKDQIVFLDKEASKYIVEFLANSKMTEELNTWKYNGKDWSPFKKNYFKIIEEFTEFGNDDKLKKWLYNRGLPFKDNVFLIPNFGDNCIYTTWKMVVKYAPNIFFHDDVVIFDKTINWGLFYFHEDHMYFGKDNIYDPEEAYKKVEELNDLKKKYPNIKFLF
jgi:hypothetical protein